LKSSFYRVLAGLVLIGVAASACRPQSPNVAAGPTATPKPVSVDVTTVKRGDIQSTLTYSGSVQAASQINIVPKISGRIQTLNVDVGSVVKAGDVIAVLDTSTLQPQLQQAQAALISAETKLDQMKSGPRAETVAQAKANLTAAEARLAAIKDGPRPEAVAQAKANLDAAKAKLAQLKAGPTSEQVKAAQLAVDQAKNALYAAQVQKDGACNPRNPDYLCKSAQASAFAAQTAVEQAQQQLTILTSPPTKDVLDQAQAAVDAAQQQYDLARAPYTAHDIAQAEAAVDVARAQLQLAQQPYTDQDLKLAQTAVDQAKAGLDLVKLQLDDAKVTSPIDGVIAQKLLDQGAMASPSTPIVLLVSRSVEVDINVEESKLGLVAPGQKATLLVPAYPGVPFNAKVVGDPPVVDPRSRTAVVRLIAEDPKGQLKPGMYAQVTVTVNPQKNVLVVPISALVNDNGKTEVYLVQNGVVTVQAVTVGVEDQNDAEVTNGLKDGQVVVVGDKPTLHDGDRVTPITTGR
jgi:HlyD family secretion protein